MSSLRLVIHLSESDDKIEYGLTTSTRTSVLEYLHEHIIGDSTDDHLLVLERVVCLLEEEHGDDPHSCGHEDEGGVFNSRPCSKSASGVDAFLDEEASVDEETEEDEECTDATEILEAVEERGDIVGVEVSSDLVNQFIE